MLCIISYCFHGDSNAPVEMVQHIEFADINPFDHRILGVVSLNRDYQVPNSVDSKVQHLKNGTRMCVLVKSGRDQFVGYQERDPFRSLVRFPMELCKTDPNWLAKKWAQISQDSGYEEDYNLTSGQSQEIPSYKLNAKNYLTSTGSAEQPQFTQVDLTK